MTHILILGANGQIARVAIDLFLKRTDARLTLYLRNARRLKPPSHTDRVRVVEGDVLDQKTLEAAMAGQDVVYSMGIYGEIPGDHHGSILDPYRKAASLIESSGLDYTLVRPAWLNDRDEIDYGTTQKGELFKNGSEQVSRKSVADLVVKLATIPGLEIRSSLGVHKGI